MFDRDVAPQTAVYKGAWWMLLANELSAKDGAVNLRWVCVVDSSVSTLGEVASNIQISEYIEWEVLEP